MYQKTLETVLLKRIDDLIDCINGKHKDFQFDRIHDGNPYMFRTILVTREEAEEEEDHNSGR